MKFDVDELSPVQRKVRVELPAETVAKEFSRAYKNLGQRVRLRGFRTGKIPRTVLQGMYGDEVKVEVKSHLVEKSLGEVIKERGLEIVSRPDVETAELDEGGAFSFSAVFEVKPEIQVKDYLGMELEKIRLSVAEAQVDDALRRLQEDHARLEPVKDRDQVQRGDFVTLDFSGTVDGQPFSGSKGENYLLEVGSGRALPQFEEAVVGLKVDVPQSVRVNYPEDYPNKEIAGKAVEFSVVAREIKQKVLPPLDDEFAKDYGDCASLGELRGKIRERLEEELRHYQNEDLKEKIVSRLIESHAFIAPPSMVERQTRYLMERYQSQLRSRGAESEAVPPMEEARKNLEARALRQVRATLLIEKIAQVEKIEVADRDVQERIDRAVRAAGERAKSVREYYSRPEAREELRAQIAFDRTLDYLLEKARIKEIEVETSKVDEAPQKS
ncbi:MAG TPA: trigger factor [Candidatus Binatia bacterium]|nr:trigger factor [Candidatus Binatia bacterium]